MQANMFAGHDRLWPTESGNRFKIHIDHNLLGTAGFVDKASAPSDPVQVELAWEMAVRFSEHSGLQFESEWYPTEMEKMA